MPVITVVPAPVGKMVDTNRKVTAQVLDALANHGYQGILRYVPLPGVDPREDIDGPELEMILIHPFRFFSFFVQHPRFPGWKPRAHDPEVDAMCAVRFARAAGYLSGTTGVVDAEGMHADTTWQEAHAYNSRWSHVMVEEGFRAGLYDGFSEPETPEQLYEIHDVTTYLSDMANRRVAVRGTSVVQGPGFELLGIPFDPDEVRLDNMGETPMVVRAEA